MSAISLTAVIVTLPVLTISYLAISRLILSPIARFPGPWLAALTFWYEFYYDVVLGGRYTWKIKELHDQYGPIVRINPCELHVYDPSFYPTLFAGPTERRDKWAWSIRLFGLKHATFATIPHDLHRRRRAALGPPFSKAAITRLEPEIRDKVEQLCDRIGEFKDSGIHVDLGVVYAALTTDVITSYCFGKSYGCLDAPDFRPQLYWAVQANAKTSVLNKQFGWLAPLLRSLPTWMVRLLNPRMMQMVSLGEYIHGQVQSNIGGSADDQFEFAERATVFHQLAVTKAFRSSEKIDTLLTEECISIVGAGLASTGDTLRVTTFHILSNPDILQRLQLELATVIPDPSEKTTLKVLEQLPYLSAVVNEGLRIACGICTRLERVSPDAPLTFRDWIIPPGTPVSMTIYLMHYNAEIFRKPMEFRPERWLESNEWTADTGYLVPFSKGARACVSQYLALGEIYLVLAYIFRRYDLVLHETTREDVDIQHDYFTAFPRLDSKGVRVLIK